MKKFQTGWMEAIFPAATFLSKKISMSTQKQLKVYVSKHVQYFE